MSYKKIENVDSIGTGEEVKFPPSCKPIPTALYPVVDANSCEANGECVKVCPYDVFEMHRYTKSETGKMRFLVKLKVRIHGNQVAITPGKDNCHSCGICVTSCPENAIKLSWRDGKQPRLR